MSAYICSQNHFVYLVAAAMQPRLNRYGNFRWNHAGVTHELPGHDFERAAEVGNMLLRENIRSVAFRYQDRSSASLPGPIQSFQIHAGLFRARPFQSADPVQVLKSIKCLDYQSCETQDWEQTEAFAFLRALTSAAIHALKGYEDAEWGAPEFKGPTAVVVRIV